MFSRYPVRLSVNRRSAGTWLVVVIALARKANRGRSARGSRHGSRTPYSGRRGMDKLPAAVRGRAERIHPHRRINTSRVESEGF
jgi:hypothetical protein